MPQEAITTQEELDAAKADAGVFEKDATEKMDPPPETFDPENDKDKYFKNAAAAAAADEAAAAVPAADTDTHTDTDPATPTVAVKTDENNKDVPTKVGIATLAIVKVLNSTDNELTLTQDEKILALENARKEINPTKVLVDPTSAEKVKEEEVEEEVEEEGAREGGRRRSKRKGRKGSRKSKKGGKKQKQQQSQSSQNGGRRSRKNRRKQSLRSKH